jgi:hypothetical protein
VAVLYITEYAGLTPSPVGGLAQLSQENPLAEQTVSIGVSSAQSSAFNAKTRIVRLHCDAVCSVEFGTNPTATSSTQRLAANQTEVKGVPVGASFKVAVIQNS